MERIILACGGNGVNSFDDLTEADLGYCDRVWEESLGDDKYTFIDGVKNPFSCTILVKGPNGYSIAQVKDAVRDGLRAVKNVFDDDGVLPGAASFEIACSDMLKEYSKSVEGKKVFGVNAFSEALLIIPKAICENAGVDPQEAIVNAAKAYRDNKKLMGIDLKNEGKPVNPIDLGIFDNFCVKRSFLNIGPVLVQQLLMVDEILRAGRQMGGNKLNQ